MIILAIEFAKFKICSVPTFRMPFIRRLSISLIDCYSSHFFDIKKIIITDYYNKIMNSKFSQKS